MQDLKNRTKQFSIGILKFCDSLEKNSTVQIIQKQLMRSCTSVAANYRAACRAQSKAAFIAKLAIVEEEADESLFWLELIEELGLNNTNLLKQLQDEANQLTAIIVASRKTAKTNR
ncbi:MAG: four helix bundle protein [Rhodothermales bacterium]